MGIIHIVLFFTETSELLDFFNILRKVCTDCNFILSYLELSYITLNRNELIRYLLFSDERVRSEPAQVKIKF